ncbi:hypothetical protein CFOL_v3_09744 [Cephalotus follicularis]|uniref:Uncharacterized protein n=1 Tax=Cephalotus follicularis TaxID=3775 RepID=A0A1Q3BEF6_CEPFO|nr:hypothetical protein CFOL_v3_09744 [Cephalotus follicularis]
MEIKLAEVEQKVPRFEEVVCKKELVKDCSISEENFKKAQPRYVTLLSKIKSKESECDALEAKFRGLEAEKVKIEDELNALKRRNGELNEGIHCGREREIEGVLDLTGEDEKEAKVVQLMIKNKVLEAEKKKAETEIEVWKVKCKELELRVLQLEKVSKMRDGEEPLNGKVKAGSGLTHVGTTLGDLQTKKEVLELVGEGSTSIPPGQGVAELQTAGTPCNISPCKLTTSSKGEKRGSQIKRVLVFEEDESPRKKITPSTPGGAISSSHVMIDISDSDDEPNAADNSTCCLHNQENGKVCNSAGHVSGGTVGIEKEMTPGIILKKTLCYQSFNENLDTCMDNALFISTPKRKKAANIVTSDTESDDDDNVPICNLKRMCLQDSISDQGSSDCKSCSVTCTLPLNDNVTIAVTPRRRRLATLRQCEGKCGSAINSIRKTSENKSCQDIPSTEDVEYDESKEFESESEGESLGGFIVDSSDVSDGNNASSALQDVSDENIDGDDASSESQGVPDDNMDFDDILSILQRRKESKFNWEFEADMLAAFGKDPELCMKAVCAVYRQQTSEEKNCKETLCYNGRGFSKFDANRGTTLAEFLTDGDPKGDLKKSVKQLEVYDSKAVETCRTLASRYSKQLFEIYKNKEDPFFLPS